MLDFTSSLYLGLRHECRSLEPWAALTLGRPAALQEPGEAVAAAQELASLAGCAAGTLLPSTFHLFWDLLGVLSREPIEIYVDAATYPIARWSAEHWAGKGVPLWPFPRHDAKRLGRLLGRCRARPLVLCDGVCVGSRSQPPLAAYAALAHRHGGWLVIDDTQGLGVFGHSASPTAPSRLAAVARCSGMRSAAAMSWLGPRCRRGLVCRSRSSPAAVRCSAGSSARAPAAST